jgi:hypothetical protein
MTGAAQSVRPLDHHPDGTDPNGHRAMSGTIDRRILPLYVVVFVDFLATT